MHGFYGIRETVSSILKFFYNFIDSIILLSYDTNWEQFILHEVIVNTVLYVILFVTIHELMYNLFN